MSTPAAGAEQPPAGRRPPAGRAPAGRPPAGEPPFRDVLRELPARVWIVSLGILVNRCGNFLPVFIVLYLTSRHYSPGAAGVVLGAAGVGNVLGNAFGGYLADRIGRRWTTVLSGVTTAVFTAAVPLLHTLPLIVVMVGLVGTASQVYRPAASALLVDSVTTNRQRVAAFAVFRFAMNIGAAAGGLVGGWLATASYPALFLGNAAASLLFGLIALALLRDVGERPGAADQAGAPDSAPPGAPDGAGAAPGGGRAGGPGGYRQALADRRLRRFLLMTLAAELVYIQSTVGLPLHVTDIGHSATDFGLLIGLNGLLVLLFELPITSFVAGRTTSYVLAVGNLFTGVGLALTGLAGGMGWLAGTVVLWTFGEMLYSSMANAYLGGLAPPGLVGRYQGLYGAAGTLGTGVGPLIGGAIYALDERALWWSVAVVGLLSAQLCLPARRHPSPAPAPAPSAAAPGPVKDGAPDPDASEAGAASP